MVNIGLFTIVIRISEHHTQNLFPKKLGVSRGVFSLYSIVPVIYNLSRRMRTSRLIEILESLAYSHLLLDNGWSQLWELWHLVHRSSLHLLLVKLVSLVEEGQLHGTIAHVAGEQHHISGLHHPSEPHEEARVEEQCSGHSHGDTLWWLRVEVQGSC